MISAFLKSKSRNKNQKLIPRGPLGKCAYVIGDVHGCIVELRSLLDQIKSHALNELKSSFVESIDIVFLGDLIDRGPSSNEVIDFLTTYKPEFASVIYIMGNHEEIFLNVLSGNSKKTLAWLDHGGMACARSYGVENLGQVYSDPDEVMYRVQRQVPQSHIDFISGFKDYHIFGDYLCVHAGIKPGVSLERQSKADMRWIRERFLSYEKPHAYKIIHGHSVVRSPENRNNRIAVDTGAYRGGALTAAFIREDEVEFIQSNLPDEM